MRSGRAQAAFSLLEMMVAIAIIAILVSICYPSYQQYVLRTYRSEATSQLYLLANAQEQYIADYGLYTADFSKLGWQSPPQGSRYYYRITLLHDNQGYQLTASATGLQQADSDCPEFTLNHLGQRNVLSPQYLACWH
ncbi:type IV pilin protein [Rheinheimera gaetbuli]